ncbi:MULTISPECIES: hypothetical protein [Rhodococcus]|uniref:hypothetical protein n=1 Tax=Rhodococcus TaxID=1827 RepID=UPI00135AF0B7|nr:MULTISPECIES: hypothetical protein [Rhodococcus]KAF0956729.1 hypothetical protein MLGJGCBP_10137 [Rhodococcus sp. T7]KAF0966602.1 hypothetical protein MLGJGCBP_00227 [Rhodococcus sp. T7]UOT08365.1 hypothetical protein MPY17_39425 [Rhodococcus opacus]
MTVHIGQITSEVDATSPATATVAAGDKADEWEERARLAAMLDRLERDRRRTSTGYGDD